MLTDGMLEHHGEKIELPALLTRTSDLQPREATLTLTSAILDAAEGQLDDDATVMCLDWHGPGGPAARQLRRGHPASLSHP